MLNEDDEKSENEHTEQFGVEETPHVEDSLQDPDTLESLREVVLEKSELVAYFSYENMQQAQKIMELMSIIEK